MIWHFVPSLLLAGSADSSCFACFRASAFLTLQAWAGLMVKEFSTWATKPWEEPQGNLSASLVVPFLYLPS